ncbi:MAG TPA: MurR/RpiR family transcriptional regulator [Bacillota bacterium]|nr:MAG: HTH-type transcriptional regulator MurR [Firmicutes bacterium ADurb.Bin153]HNV34048.1 MurR/RpiR family transcriptional regulator [Bacillota bacterium]
MVQRKGHLVRVESLFAKLAPSEQKVAVSILEDPAVVIDMGISELAKRSGSSEAAVVRFCKKAGFAGFKQFKTAMSQEFGSAPPPEIKNALDEHMKESGSVESIIRKVRDLDVSVLNEALLGVDREQLDGAAERLASAKRVAIFAAGLSGTVASELNNRLMRFGFDSQYETSSYAQLMQASKLTPDDCAVGISYSGSTKEIVEAMGLARNTGASTIGITSLRDSPLARGSDFVIAPEIRQSQFDVGMWSIPRIVGLAVVDVLMMAVAFKMGREEGDGASSRRALLDRLGIGD